MTPKQRKAVYLLPLFLFASLVVSGQIDTCQAKPIGFKIATCISKGGTATVSRLKFDSTRTKTAVEYKPIPQKPRVMKSKGKPVDTILNWGGPSLIYQARVDTIKPGEIFIVGYDLTLVKISKSTIDTLIINGRKYIGE